MMAECSSAVHMDDRNAEQVIAGARAGNLYCSTLRIPDFAESIP